MHRVRVLFAALLLLIPALVPAQTRISSPGGAGGGGGGGGVTSLTGTANQVIVSSPTGAVTLSTPQNIGTASTPTFGSLTLSGLTQGSVLFAGTGGAVSQDNAQLFWDDTTNRFGIGTPAPSGILNVFSAGTALDLALRLEQRSASPTDIAMAFGSTTTGETQSYKAGIGFARNQSNGRGRLTIYNNNVNDGASFTGSDLIALFHHDAGSTSSGMAVTTSTTSPQGGWRALTVRGNAVFIATAAMGGFFEIWKDEAGGGGAPTKAVAFGPSESGGAVTDDFYFSTWSGSAWTARMKIMNGTGFIGMGAYAPGGITPSALLSLQPTLSTDPGLLIKGAVLQTGDLVQYQDSAAAVLGAVKAGGGVLSRSFRSSKTANYPVVAADSGTQFDNIGAGATVNFTLPTALAGLKYGFCVKAAQTVQVTAAASTTIALGASISAAAGNITANVAYACTELEAISTTEWVANSVTGSWTVN